MSEKHTFLPHKKLSISLLISFILIFHSNNVFCQVFDGSQNPPALKWRQINTPEFRLIYPLPIENEAMRMAGTLNSIIKKVSKSYGRQPRKISIILQNQGTTANGFVQLAPRRSEFFTTPSQEFDFQDWLNSLAVHELRHVVQFDKLAGGFKAPLEALALAIFGVDLPPWFYEGDAVGIETALTFAGRGRQPEFDLVLRTNTLSGRKFSYSKDYLGSLKNPTAGYYPLGFYMTTKLRRDHGPMILDNILSEIATHPISIYNFSNALRKFAGISTRTLHDSTIAEMGARWQADQEASGAHDYPVLYPHREGFPVNYLLPVALPSGKIAAIKQGLANTARIVTIDNLGKESAVQSIGYQEIPYFRYAAGHFIWDEFRYDKRYQKRSYNVILLKDLATGRTRQLTHKTRLFAPALSPDGTLIAAVSIGYDNKISLALLDGKGKLLRKFQSPGNDQLQNPSFSLDGKRIVMTGVSARGKTLYEFDRLTGTFKRLFPYQLQLISMPVYAGEATIVFKAHYNGIDNLAAFDQASGRFSGLTTVKYGAYNPSFDEQGKRLLFNNYGPDGQAISFLPWQGNANAVNLSALPSGPVKDEYIAPVTRQEGSANVFDSIASRSFLSRPYRELGHLLNIHSLIPILEKNDKYTGSNNYGVKLQSDNKLNTFSAYAGYRFNEALKKNEYLAGVRYSRLFPVIELSYRNEARFFRQQQIIDSRFLNVPINWRENTFEADITAPFTFNRLNRVYTLSAEAGTSYISRYKFSNTPENFTYTYRFPLVYRLALGSNSIRSPRDLAPKWGQNLRLIYRHSPFESRLKGNSVTFESNWYIPGIFDNHSLQVSFNAQHSSASYSSINDIPMISGYEYLLHSGVPVNTLLSAYRFPLFYPDWEVGPFAYIKRFSGSIFAGMQDVFTGRPHPSSYGAEIKADMNLLRFYIPDFSFSARLTFSHYDPTGLPLVQTGFTYTY